MSEIISVTQTTTWVTPHWTYHHKIYLKGEGVGDGRKSLFHNAKQNGGMDGSKTNKPLFIAWPSE